MPSRCHADTMCNLVQWSIDDFGSLCRSQLQPVCLDIGNCEWSFVLENKVGAIHFGSTTTALLVIKPSPKLDGDIGTHLLIVSFTIRVVSLSGCRKTLYYKEVKDKRLYHHENFDLKVDVPFTGRVVVQVEFLNLKTTTANVGESPSIWCDRFAKKDLNATAAFYLGKMFSENTPTDITICASEGTTIGAHQAVLKACSPVFRRMFSHDLKEKEMSAINISDMSIEACKAFLNYIYSKIKDKNFIVHRLDLLRAADKYDVSDLKDECEESLLEDIDTKNVLERLQSASLYRLPRLKVCCLQYLMKFGKIFEIREEFNGFIQSGDRELIGEVINEVLSV